MYFKKLFILLLVSSSFSYAEEIPERIKPLTDSIIKIRVEGFDQNKEPAVGHGTGFLIKDENGQLRVVTNFHVIDGMDIVKSISARKNGKKILLEPDAFSPLRDITLLKVKNSTEHLGKPLELREQALKPGERLYTLGFISEDKHLTLIPMDFIAFSDHHSELKFILDTPITHFKGASGAPIMDKTGKVVGVFTSVSNNEALLSYGFGPETKFLLYSTNKDFIKCPKSPMASRACIIQSRLKLFEKIQSNDLITSEIAKNKITEIYGHYNVKDFIQSFEMAKNISGKKIDLQMPSQIFDRSNPVIKSMIDGSDYTVEDFIIYSEAKKAPELQAPLLQFTRKEALESDKVIRNTVSDLCKNSILK